MRNLYKFVINNKPAGVTSLLVVVGISMVFVVIITGLTSLSIREAQQALSNDLSNRALAAAESSARDAAQWVEKNPGAQYPNCDQDNELSRYNIPSTPDNETEIVCRTVSLDTKEVVREVKQDQSTLIFVNRPDNSSSRANKMSFSWGKSSSNNSTLDVNNLYPLNLGDTTPAIVELTFFSWPDTGIKPDTSPESIQISTILISPTSEPKDSLPGDFKSNTSGKCEAIVDSDYLCNIGIILPALLKDKNLTVQIKPRYKNVDFKAQFYTGNPDTNPITVRPSTALIDVTARVGSYYRRIQAEKPLENSAFITDVLYSNKSVCKNLIVDSSHRLISGNTCLE